ncbi:hypothetical protein [Chryseobacterium aquaeductus]|uniref:hypothetical protein n=1 Tax=Chryseobacterium aquaeductus TaxID=2675056 RepID=UPI001389D00C|nr:hypothetical protein [Chryseobacterium aquaeductus]
MESIEWYFRKDFYSFYFAVADAIIYNAYFMSYFDFFSNNIAHIIVTYGGVYFIFHNAYSIFYCAYFTFADA